MGEFWATSNFVFDFLLYFKQFGSFTSYNVPLNCKCKQTVVFGAFLLSSWLNCTFCSWRPHLQKIRSSLLKFSVRYEKVVFRFVVLHTFVKLFKWVSCLLNRLFLQLHFEHRLLLLNALHFKLGSYFDRNTIRRKQRQIYERLWKSIAFAFVYYSSNTGQAKIQLALIFCRNWIFGTNVHFEVLRTNWTEIFKVQLAWCHLFKTRDFVSDESVWNHFYKLSLSQNSMFVVFGDQSLQNYCQLLNLFGSLTQLLGTIFRLSIRQFIGRLSVYYFIRYFTVL